MLTGVAVSENKLCLFKQMSAQLSTIESLSPPHGCFDVEPYHLLKFIFASSLSEPCWTLSQDSMCIFADLGTITFVRGAAANLLKSLTL